MKYKTIFKVGIPALLFSTLFLFSCADDSKGPVKDSPSIEKQPDIKPVPDLNNLPVDTAKEQPADTVNEATTTLRETHDAIEDVTASYEPENEFNLDDLTVSNVIEQTPAPDPTEVIVVDTKLVSAIQQTLIDRGFNSGTADGISGPKTLAALTAFQKENGLMIGEFTRETLEALNIEFD